jgi:polyisoprenoid-binding protein YceI
MRKPLIAATLAAGLVALPVIAQNMTAPGTKDVSQVKAGTYTVDSAHTQVAWRVNHLGFNDYFGLFGNATGTLTIDPAKPAAATVSIDIPVNSLATSSADLNKHMFTDDFLAADKHPVATFRSTSVAVDGTTAKITGNLTLRGVTKAVVLDAEFSGAGVGPMNKKDTIGFHATTTVKRSDFGMTYGIPMVPDDVALTISVAFEREG